MREHRLMICRWVAWWDNERRVAEAAEPSHWYPLGDRMVNVLAIGHLVGAAWPDVPEARGLRILVILLAATQLLYRVARDRPWQRKAPTP